jgi:hypothetical protein
MRVEHEELVRVAERELATTDCGNVIDVGVFDADPTLQSPCTSRES